MAAVQKLIPIGWLPVETVSLAKGPVPPQASPMAPSTIRGKAARAGAGGGGAMSSESVIRGPLRSGHGP